MKAQERAGESKPRVLEEQAEQTPIGVACSAPALALQTTNQDCPLCPDRHRPHEQLDYLDEFQRLNRLIWDKYVEIVGKR
jgi:hypothetical protein